MTKPLVFMLSGQGSHYYQMGRQLFDQEPEFRRWMMEIDTMVADHIGESIVELIYADKNPRHLTFDRMLHTHPAIFMVEYSLAKTLMHRGVVPDYFLGASLGEFASIALASSVNLEAVVTSLLEQAKLCETLCPPGKMLAIFDRFESYHETSLIQQHSDLASVNFKNHFVVAGKPDHINNIESYLSGNEILSQEIAVSFAFHSRDFDPLEPYFLQSFANWEGHRLDTPLISSSAVDEVTQISADFCWGVVRKSIEFYRAFNFFRKRGPATYLDIGPSGTLATFAKNILRGESGSTQLSILTPFGDDMNNFNSVLSTLAQQQAQAC